MGFRIEHIWAFVSVDPDDGDEGIIAAPAEGGVLMPLICADQARLDSAWPVARDIARRSGRVVRLVRFDVRVELEEIAP